MIVYPSHPSYLVNNRKKENMNNPMNTTQPTNFSYQESTFMRIGWRQLLSISGNFSVIVHGPNGCGSDFSLPTTEGTERHADCTNLTESNAIYGGEQVLSEKIESVYLRDKPEAIFILNTEVPELIGDDIAGIAHLYQKKYNIPVIAMPTSGLSDRNLWKSNSVALMTIIENIMQPCVPAPDTINIITSAWIPDTETHNELIQKCTLLGIKVHISMLGKPSLQDLIKAPQAELNVFTEEKQALEVGEKMKERFGIPYIKVTHPFGIQGTLQFFKDIVLCMNPSDEKLALIDSWEQEIRSYIEQHFFLLKNKSMAMVGSRSLQHIIEAFENLGFRVTMFSKEAWENNSETDKYDFLYVLSEGWEADNETRSEQYNISNTHRKSLFIKSPSYFLFFSGLIRMGQEIACDSASGFYNKYGKYLN